MKTIIEMAREAGFAFEEQDNLFVVDPDGVCKFAELVRAEEREACANACEDEICNCCWDEQAGAVAEHLAETIRARGYT